MFKRRYRSSTLWNRIHSANDESPSRLRRLKELGVTLIVVSLAVAASRYWMRSSSIQTTNSSGSSRSESSPDHGEVEVKQAVSGVSRVHLAPGKSTTKRESDVDRLAAKLKLSADADDWDSEWLTEQVLLQLAKWRDVLEQGPAANQQPLLATLPPNVTCQLGFTVADEVTWPDGIFRARRLEGLSSAPSGASPSMPADQFAKAIEELLARVGTHSRRMAMKVQRVEKQPDAFRTQVRLEVAAELGDESRQLIAILLCRWTYPNKSTTGNMEQAGPLLQSIELTTAEEMASPIKGGPLFAECTPSILGANASYQEQVLPGILHWLSRLSREFTGQFGHHGLALGDVNGDQLDDLYLCDTGGLPNRLYVRQPDGTAKDVSRESGVDFLDDSAAALLVDLDNDGDQDLVVTTDPLLLICENDGTGRFTRRVARDVDTDALSLSAADYDGDGKLDLYVCGYNVRKQDPSARGLPFPVPYHDANNGGRNLLLRNEGHFQFVDVTREVGLDENNSRFSMAASWEDYDNDGDLDLYVANDFGRNNLYVNSVNVDGRFRDLASQARVEDQASGMSVSWADCDRDGRMDLYVSNMYSSAGNRVTYQNRFREGRSSSLVSHLQRMARGNTLLINQTDQETPRFEDQSEWAGVEMGRWAWASKFVDLTNDGWQDLVVTNGYLTNEDKTDL